MDSYHQDYGEYKVVEVLNEDVHFVCNGCGKQHKTRLVRLNRPWSPLVFQRDGKAMPYTVKGDAGQFCSQICMITRVVERIALEKNLDELVRIAQEHDMGY